MAINRNNLDNISDLYRTSSVDFPVTALLFESDLNVSITNNYTVSDGSAFAFGTFNGKWVSEAGISMPRNSQFVTIAILDTGLTVTQKLVVNWENEENHERETVEFDLVVNYIS